ncbi:putative LOW QUALITY PROTEIN: C-terminus superfamily protein [Rosellinia necatrix]|uniref:Putative LOW QUALITY PROTEIN: C-terminus superfamily protein n=1 Tax=Rosellinia necatrix TaxID=77044 RepID=A0A1W2TVA8_ROSNE|nr:putative LOW QUALITY PROTEIN: C-terminus superfamily protein [Rosellinia necatrix]
MAPPPRRPVIAVAGLSCETSTFSASRTTASAFHPRRGDAEVAAKYAFIGPGSALGDAAVWRGALIGHALPGGVVTAAAFEALAAEIEWRLADIVASAAAESEAEAEPAGGRRRRLDGLWFDIHGAMCVEGLDDAEAELLRRVRAVVGPDVLVSASMDLHGNVSRALAHQADLLTCYRTAPHVDVAETKERACRNLLALIARRDAVGEDGAAVAFRPYKAWIPLPVLLPGEQTSTRDEPAARIYAAVPAVAAAEGIVDAAVWVGYAWADEPRNRAAVVVTGWDRAAASRGAEALARAFWDARREFRFVAPTGSLAACLDAALRSDRRPYFVSDSGDNPTAGGSGDVTWGLTQLLARPEFRHESGPVVIYASVPGREAVEKAVEAGVGAVVTVTAGAEIDSIHAGPLTMTGRVHSIKHGDRHADIEVVLQVGSVYAILTKLRKPYHLERDFTDLDLTPRSADIVIVKIGYLEPELYDMAKDWMLGLTPGGVNQDLVQLGHKRILRPMWPFDRDFEEPDLSSRIVEMSNEKLAVL